MALRQPAKKTTSALEMLDFGPGVPVTLTEAGEAAMSRLPQKALRCVIAALREWASSVPVKAVRGVLYVDVEDASWRDFLIELLIDCPVEVELQVIDDVAAVIDSAMEKLPAKEQARLNESLAVLPKWIYEWDLGSIDTF